MLKLILILKQSNFMDYYNYEIYKIDFKLMYILYVKLCKLLK